jgi:hypothetical protein
MALACRMNSFERLGDISQSCKRKLAQICSGPGTRAVSRSRLIDERQLEVRSASTNQHIAGDVIRQSQRNNAVPAACSGIPRAGDTHSSPTRAELFGGQDEPDGREYAFSAVTIQGLRQPSYRHVHTMVSRTDQFEHERCGILCFLGSW